MVKNILFIMFDQLRWDYLSCAGHPHLHTPHLDRLAARGVRFDRAYIQSPLCGPSRMSTYTGRYVSSHGAVYNKTPLKVGEMTLGDHLRGAGMNTYLIGKTHMEADRDGMARLGIDPDSLVGRRLSECGFDVVERDDGLRPEGPDGFYDPKGALAYNDYLRARGYASDNPWHDFANSGRDEQGRVKSGWFLRNSTYAANIAEPDSETPYLTRRGIEFIDSAQGPWCLHLSYIKPHWPYVAPEPYASMYGPDAVLPLNRTDAERDTAHPWLKAMMTNAIGKSFWPPDVRDGVVRAYMGLVKQIDDQMGVLFDFLERTGRMDDTLIVVTSDHGDYLGDHWIGEKQFFHDCAARVPMIVYDPSPAADATRGTVSQALVESIDLVPTFIDYAGGTIPDHIVEGHSLRPLIHGQAQGVRAAAIAEWDHSMTPMAARMGLSPRDARIFMVATSDWKMVHFEGGLRPVLFDLRADPDELHDLGASPDHADVIADMYVHLNAWFRRVSQRTTLPTAEIMARRAGGKNTGVVLGAIDETDRAPETVPHYIGRTAPDWRTLVKPR